MSKFIVRKTKKLYHIFRVNDRKQHVLFCTTSDEDKSKIIVEALVKHEELTNRLKGNGVF